MFPSLSKILSWSIYFAIVAVYTFSFIALINYQQNDSEWKILDVIPILKYSVLQAGLSAILSTLLGILLARSFFYLNFRGKAFLYKIISFVWRSEERRVGKECRSR